jgi:hypothetical protein
LEKARREEEGKTLDGLAFKNKERAIRLGDVAGCWRDGCWLPAE